MTASVLCIKEALQDKSSSLKESDCIQFVDKELTFKVYKSIHDCEEYWDDISCEDPFYSADYFKILEDGRLKGGKPLYAFVFAAGEERPVASYYMHKKKFKLSESIDIEKFKEEGGFWPTIKYYLQRIFFPMVYFNMLVVGNLLLTGKYGFRGTDNKIQNIDYAILRRLLKNLKCKVKGTEYKYRGALIKDFNREERCTNNESLGLAELQVDPSMVLNVRESWESMDDYLLDMKSKHRVRTKKHLKKASDLEIRTLSIEEAKLNEDKIFSLYDSVVTASGFNMASANKGYFTDLVTSFPDQFFIDGIFLEDELVGFFSYMFKGGAMMSHFIGYNEEKNKEYSIYMNILLGLIRNSISAKVKKLYYYRTALEIKSSVGAVPDDLYCYLVHNNGLINRTVKLIIKVFFPEPQWTPRNPFKS